MKSKEQGLQEQEYKFPYHHLLNRDQPRGVEYFAYLDQAIRFLKKSNPSLVLDIGCGDGKSTQELDKHFEKVIGIDYSPKAISFAQAFSPQITFLNVNIVEDKIIQKGEAALCMEVIEHIPPNKLPEFIKAISKLLKPGSTLVITTPTTLLKIPKKHYQHFTEEKISLLLEKDFIKRKVIYHQKKNIHLLFFILRGILTNRWYNVNIRTLNRLLIILYTNLVRKASVSNGQRIIYVAEKR